MVSSVGAVPLLSVGSNANYKLNASVQASQSCNATPSTYNQTACGPSQPMQLVNIYDDGVCASNSPYCYYSPSSLTISLGTTVMWFNRGSLTHTVTSSGYSGPNSPYLAPKASYSFTFNTAGNYSYYFQFIPGSTEL